LKVDLGTELKNKKMAQIKDSRISGSKQKKETKMATKKPITEKKKIIAKTKPAKATINVECNDSHCPIHSAIKTRGRMFEGVVVRSKMAKTITVQWPRRVYLSKYERFEKRRSKVKAHNSACINAKAGDMVKIAECRPIAKSKNFVVVEIIKKMGDKQ
jgi:small subunit ribosomal protein S17